MSAKKPWIALLGFLIVSGLVVGALFRLGIVSLSSGDEEPPVDLHTLGALPYTKVVVESEERKQKVGVVLNSEKLTYPGVNLYCNHFEASTGAFLIDMDGNTVHRWSGPDSAMWKAVTLDKGGNAYGILQSGDDIHLAKMDWNSNVAFDIPGPFHHDIQFMEDGTIVTLKYDPISVRVGRRSARIVNDRMVFISSEGQVIKEVSLYDLLEGQKEVQHFLGEALTPRAHRLPFDLLHTNTVNVLKQDIPGFCKRGDVLICMRNLNLVLVYDPKTERIVWQYYGSATWQHPHEPTLLGSGRLLIFDNGPKRGWSRVIEMDPLTEQVVWEYEADPETDFYTEVRGSAQRFPNGNTLVVESDSGRVFEITRDGEIVWEWYNPHFSDEGRAIVYKMKRFEPDVVEAWMASN